MNLNLKVIYVDSLPFLWSEKDYLPYNVSVYCAQQCLEMPIQSGKQISKINNLKWVNPITPTLYEIQKLEKEDFVLLNLGGLHSPIGEGIEYAKIVLTASFNALKNKGYKKIKITCGNMAFQKLSDLISKLNVDNILEIKVGTMSQIDYLSEIKKSSLFITSPGLTSIYETATLNIPTVILPPQNLSQYYNINFACRLIKNVQLITWEENDLSFKNIEPYLNEGEEFVVKKIYELISSYKDNVSIMKNIEEKIINAIEKVFINGGNSYTFEQNGTQQVLNELIS